MFAGSESRLKLKFMVNGTTCVVSTAVSQFKGKHPDSLKTPGLVRIQRIHKTKFPLCAAQTITKKKF